MLKKEKILIGTENEIRDYYLNELKVVKRDESSVITLPYLEFSPFESQIKMLKNGFGIIFYFKVKKTKKEVKLIVKRIFVWVIQEVKK